MKEIRDKAREALKDGKISEALELFNAQLKLEPEDQLTLRYVAQLHERRGDYVEATEYISKLVELNRSDETLTMMAQNALKRQQFEEAIQYGQDALNAVGTTNGFSTEALTIMADAAFKSGDLKQSAEYYADVIKNDDDNVRGLTGMGTIMLSNQQYDEALHLFDKVLHSNPHHMRALLGKGLTLMAMERRDEAADYLCQALSLEPDNSWALATVLPLLSENGQLDRADKHLKSYLDIFPDDHPMLLARAGVAFAQGNYSHSRNLLDTCLAQDPDYPGAVDLDRELSKVTARNEQQLDPVLA